MFPMLDQSSTEKEFETNLTLHVNLLNDLINATCSATETSELTKIYKKNELYKHFFPRLSIAPTNRGYMFCLDLCVKNLSEMIDTILKDRISNAYLKIIENECRKVNAQEALARIARENEDLLAEESEEDEEPHMDDIINEQYDAVFSFAKKKRQDHNKKQKKRSDLVSENEDEDENSNENEVNEVNEVKKPSNKYKESSLKKRKISKLNLVREDKRAFNQLTAEQEKEEEELDYKWMLAWKREEEYWSN